MRKIYIFILVTVFVFVNSYNAQDQKCILKNVNLNSKYQDFDLVSLSDSLVVFSSSRKQRSLKQPKWSGNNQPYLELYSAEINAKGFFSDIKKFSKTINTKYHDADIEFSKDLKTVYFSRSNYFKKKYVKDTLGRNLIQLYKATQNEKGKWIEEEMPFNSRNYQTGHPTLNEDETILYFVSDMPGGYGKTDIYMVEINDDGTYGNPINLGPNVNTKGKELFPEMWKNNDLYFSSDGYVEGQGGLDIFSVRLEEGKPTENSLNLPRPINSYSDDFSISFGKNKNYGYFSSNRPGGKGDDDIYSFQCSCEQYIKGITYEDIRRLDSIKAMEFYFHDDMKRIRDSINGLNPNKAISISNNQITEQDIEASIDSIFNSTDGIKILPNVKVTLFNNLNQRIDSTISNEKGEYHFTVDCLSSFKLFAEKLNYDSDEFEVNTTEQNADTVFVDFKLREKDILFKNNQHILNIDPFYYDFDKADIYTHSVIGILTIVDILRKYPSLHIEINSHTDSRGTDEYNEKLSKRRSSVMKQWIVARGISENRITTNGYGESQLVNKCSNGVKCSEEEHAKNRRSEFLITKYNESED